MTISSLPAVNASLNAVCTGLLVAGYIFIRSGNKRAHIACMALALVTSALFLTSYLIYHANAGSVKFTHEGFIRPVYYAILLSHILLAMVIVPLVLATVVPALRRRFEFHKKLARWTLPLWLYVSVTGVLIYAMLYHWFPSSELPQ